MLLTRECTVFPSQEGDFTEEDVMKSRCLQRMKVKILGLAVDMKASFYALPEILIHPTDLETEIVVSVSLIFFLCPELQQVWV